MRFSLSVLILLCLFALSCDNDPQISKGWISESGSFKDDSGSCVAIDEARNVFVTGYTYGNLYGDTNLGRDTSDIFLMKFNPDGTKQWTKQWGNSLNDFGRSVTTDNSGNVYVTGETNGNIDGNTNTNQFYDLFITKFNSYGELEWKTHWGTASNDYGSSVSVDNTGSIYVTGQTEGSFDNFSNEGFTDPFLTKINNEGKVQWTKQWGTNDRDYGYSVTTDMNGEIYVAGASGSTFLGKWDSDGNNLWTKQWGISPSEGGRSIVVDDDGSIYTAGRYTIEDTCTSVEEGQDPSCEFITTAYLTKLNSEGVEQWITSEIEFSPVSIAMDSSGNIYVTGSENNDIYLTTFNNKGKQQWTETWNSGKKDGGLSVAVDTKRNVFLTGFTEGSINYGTPYGNSDIFLIKLPAK